MPNYISRQIFKMKALDRWENEGGRTFADHKEVINSSSLDNRAGKGNDAQNFGKSPQVSGKSP